MPQAIVLNWTSPANDRVATHKLARAVETRYVRLVIEQAEQGDTEYIGLQVGVDR